ncbi:hypothetical protein ACFW04_013687 [Cataglyphis niger]
MAIRECLEYDDFIKFSRYVDLGTDIGCHSILAIEALVFFLVSCINSTWKIPIAYYLVKGISSEEKSNLVTDDKVLAFFYPCHMLKLACNTIQWSRIIKLHELQESEGMHLRNKLRNVHVNYNKQKMKV